MGYTGGSAQNPTYKSVCGGDGHTEAIRLVFDPKVISYDQLIKKVLSQASGSTRQKTQYMSAVWAHDEEQAAAAKRAAVELKKTTVPILASKETRWYDAEEYHREPPTTAPRPATSPSPCFRSLLALLPSLLLLNSAHVLCCLAEKYVEKSRGGGAACGRGGGSLSAMLTGFGSL